MELVNNYKANHLLRNSRKSCQISLLYVMYVNVLNRLGQHFNAGMVAGVMTTVIMAPGERIKCLMQVSGLDMSSRDTVLCCSPFLVD